MGIALVPRGVRALADQLNAYYRVFKGTDPDSVYVRLNSGGSLEVRHSATNAAVFSVTDAGVSATNQPGDITNPDIADGAITSAKIQDGALMDIDVNTAANIAVNKLAHVGAGNVLKSSGAANVGGQVVNADIAPAGTANIAVNKLAHVGANNLLKSDGTQNVAGQVVDADVNAAANIAVTKLAHVGANNLLRSNGTQNVGGQLVNGDVAAAAGIGVAKLAAGAANQGLYVAGGVPTWGPSTKSVLTTIGDLVYASAANTLSRLGLGTAFQVLGVNPGATAPQWMASPQSLMTAVGDMLYASGVNTPARLAGGTNGQILGFQGGIPTWVAAGGVGAGTITTNEILDGTILKGDLSPTATPQLIASWGPLGAPAGPQVFSSIPQTYKHLRVVWQGRSVVASIVDNCYVRVNGIITATYLSQLLYGAAGTPSASENLGQSYTLVGAMAGATGIANGAGGGVIDFPNYSGSSLFRMWTALAGAIWGATTGTMQVYTMVGIQTGLVTGITSIELGPVGANWAAGSMAALYGFN